MSKAERNYTIAAVLVVAIAVVALITWLPDQKVAATSAIKPGLTIGDLVGCPNQKYPVGLVCKATHEGDKWFYTVAYPGDIIQFTSDSDLKRVGHIEWTEFNCYRDPQTPIPEVPTLAPEAPSR